MTDEPIYRISPPERPERPVPPEPPEPQSPAAAPEQRSPQDPWPPEALRPRASRIRTRWMGVWAFALAAFCVLLEIVAITIGSAGEWTVSTVLGVSVIVLTVISLILGIVAIVLGRGRRWGIAAVVVSVLGNPLVQLWVLGLGATS